MRTKLSTRGQGRWLWLAAAVLALVLLLAPGAVSAGAGRMIGDLLVTTLGAVVGILAGVFGG